MLQIAIYETKRVDLFRYSVLEICAAVGGGSVEIGVGFWINRHGFFPSCVFITCSAFVALVFTIFLRSEGTTAETRDLEPLVSDKLLLSPSENTTSKLEGQEKIQKSSIMSQLREVFRIYTSNGANCDICNENGKCNNHNEACSRYACVNQCIIGMECLHCDVRAKSRLWRLWLYLVAYVIYVAGVDGYELFMTMFLVTAPLCFTPDLVGVRAVSAMCSYKHGFVPPPITRANKGNFIYVPLSGYMLHSLKLLLEMVHKNFTLRMDLAGVQNWY